MLISGIRHKINAETDARRSAILMKYVVHYMQMFAFLGVIIPILVSVDYFLTPQAKGEKVVNKFALAMEHAHKIEYYFLSDSRRFCTDAMFYENANVGDEIIFLCTPVFHIATIVTSRINGVVYECKLPSVYGWAFIFIGVTFLSSAFMIVKTWNWKRQKKYLKYDFMVNFGIINTVLCIVVLVAVLFDIL